jgi:poly(beta-D-mannuronate) lyase
MIDITDWKLTLPTGSKDKPTELQGMVLASYSDNHFYADSQGLHMIAPCDGVHTSGSKYPRCEFRELTEKGGLASWSTSKGSHAARWRVCVTHLPVSKPEVVVGQIHDDKDDVFEILHRANTVSVMHDGKSFGTLITNYRQGDEYEIEVLAEHGHINIYLNDALKCAFPKEAKNCYFKIGCYTQSNPSRGAKPGEYGEVILKALSLSHK